MVHRLDHEAESEQNLQLFHFRKVNQWHIIAPQAILKNKEELCGGDDHFYLIVEEIPTRLSEVNRLLNFRERLSILAATFSALHTLSYVYGPIMIQDNLIGFNRQGKVKIWINNNFASN